MQPKQDFSALQQRILVHNELAAKYAHQVAQLRNGISDEAEGWEALLSHLMGHCLVEGESDAEFDDETITAMIDFGFQCMGIGA
ncbi:MAG TPA: hypothetical protein QGF05_03795, partial [Dehalococcoidia bacterium]|nr:hypothetical protein [Dehalococcoidia bacterium]